MRIKFVIFQTILLALFAGGLWGMQNTDRLVRLFIKFPVGTNLGRVSEVSGDVRRRLARDLMWLPVRKGDEVFEDDVFFTGPQARAKIELKANTKVRLFADSLLRIERQGPVNILNLEGGTVGVSAEKPETMGLKSGGQMIPSVVPNHEVTIEQRRLQEPEYLQAIKSELGGPATINPANRASAQEPNPFNSAEHTAQAKPTTKPTADEPPASGVTVQWSNPIVLIFCALYLVVIALSVFDQMRARREG